MSEPPDMIPVFSNTLGEEELSAISGVLASRWLGMGRECATLEQELGTHLHCDPPLLFNCCTAAIYAALRAHAIGPGDEVIVPTINFVAIPNAIIDLGGRPVFADVDPVTFNLLPGEVERLASPRTRAVFLLHYGGHPAPFDEIRAACRSPMQIFEDAANAVASTYRGHHCGTLGDAGVFSFDAMKILVMGDGGALVIGDAQARERARSIRHLGLAPRSTSGTDARQAGHRRWWEIELSTTSGRFISNDILAAVGRVQLRKLPQFIERRRQIWQYYQQELGGLPGLRTPPEAPSDCSTSYYLYWIRVPGRRDALADHLAAHGVYTTLRYFPLHRIAHYGDRSRLPQAEAIAEDALNIPLHQNLSDSEVDRIVGAIREFMRL